MSVSTYNISKTFYYQYNKYERHDKDILRHDGFGVRTGIVSTHAKQYYKAQFFFMDFMH